MHEVVGCNDDISNKLLSLEKQRQEVVDELAQAQSVLDAAKQTAAEVGTSEHSDNFFDNNVSCSWTPRPKPRSKPSDLLRP